MTRFCSLFLFSLLLAACGGPDGVAVDSAAAIDEVEPGASSAAATAYVVDPNASTVNWEGSKLVGSSHTGTIPVVFGQLVEADGKLVGGRFTMDVRKLENTDLEDEGMRQKLVGHLKSADFFDVENHPRAEFNITSVKAAANAEDGHTHDITGNLMLKGQSRSITIPATVTMDGKQLKASTPEFVIDRTEWGMEYGSGGIEGIAQDNIINDNVGLQLTVVANR